MPEDSPRHGGASVNRARLAARLVRTHDRMIALVTDLLAESSATVPLVPAHLPASAPMPPASALNRAPASPASAFPSAPGTPASVTGGALGELTQLQCELLAAATREECPRKTLIRRAGRSTTGSSYQAIRDLLIKGLLSLGPRGGVYRPDAPPRV